MIEDVFIELPPAPLPFTVLMPDQSENIRLCQSYVMSQSDREKVEQLKITLMIAGIIRYQDAFNFERESRFSYLYRHGTGWNASRQHDTFT
ncbi:hypothetical protein KOAAANKH_00080 [Brevundimonas sp. NIBR10]|nr:hypothetical protein KOAAANKH_00080 [Brevundimonas sp. NIBR10]